MRLPSRHMVGFTIPEAATKKKMVQWWYLLGKNLKEKVQADNPGYGKRNEQGSIRGLAVFSGGGKKVSGEGQCGGREMRKGPGKCMTP